MEKKEKTKETSRIRRCTSCKYTINQTSSEISGKLPDDYRQHIGDILAAQLPAGSITGAPKDKTCAIIREAETYERGFYTGIMRIYENGELDSAVMIRFIEQTEQGMVFKAGGGITPKSDCHKEYEEVIAPTKNMDLYKARVVYGEEGIEDIQYAPYSMKDIHSLKIVKDDDIDYSFKSTDRNNLELLELAKRVGTQLLS